MPSRRRTRVLVTTGVLSGLLIVLAPGTGQAATGSHTPARARGAAHRDAWSNEDAAAFWTAERMASATPSDERRPSVTRERALVRRATPFAGIPAVGVLFSLGSGMRTHQCTASVVRSPHHNVILTAAHCGTGTHQAFVPMYDRHRDGRHQPYGVWAVAHGWRSVRYSYYGTGSNLDVAFLRVRPDARGRNVQDRTGGNRLTRTRGYVHRVTVIGYPAATRRHPDRAITCTTTSTRLRGLRQMRIRCGGFYGGTSGAPWLVRYNARTRTGDVIGNIGGRDGGGPDDVISYSPLYGAAVMRLYEQATGIEHV